MIVWRGAEDLRPFLVEPASVRLHPKNPKDHDLGAIASSLARFGQLVPILVQRSTGYVVAGNGRLEALAMVAELEETLGVGPGIPWTRIAAVFADLSDADALAYALADNRTHDLGGYFEDKLAELLSELASVPGALVATGYDRSDVDAAVASLRPFVPPDVPAADPVLGSEVRVEIACSRAFLRTVEKTLAEWARVEGVEVSIA